MSHRVCLTVCSLLLALVSRAAQGGSLSGVVRDSDGRGISDARIAAKAAGGGGEAGTTRSGENGVYRLESLPPGDYVVTADRAGFGTGKVEVHVGGSGNYTADLALRARLKLEASGVRGSIDPGGYSAPAQAAAAAGLVAGMAGMTPPCRSASSQRDSPSESDEDRLFTAAHATLLAERFEEAAAAFRSARETFPRSVKLWTGSGVAEFLAGNRNGALEALLYAVDLDPLNARTFALLDRTAIASDARVLAAFQGYAERAPDQADALYYLAKILIRSSPEEASKAEKLLNRAVALDPGLAMAHFELGALRASASDYPAAIHEYEIAVEFAPRMAEAQYRLSLAYRQAGRLDDADRALKKFQSLREMQKAESQTAVDDLAPAAQIVKPAAGCPAASLDLDPHVKAALAAMARADFARAMVELKTALRLDPASAESHYRMGLLLGQTGDFRAAELEFRHVIALRPASADAYYNLGLTLVADPRSKLDWPNAIAAFRQALQYRAHYAEAANYLGSGLLATGESDAAITEFRRAIEWNPTLREAHFNLADALERGNQTADAEREYRLAGNARGAYPAAEIGLARLLLREGHASEAQQELICALSANPDSLTAHFQMAKCWQALKRPDAAAIEFDEVADLEGRDARATQAARLTNEGLDAAGRGDWAAALKVEREAVELKPDYGVPHQNLGLVLADQGDWSGAQKELIKAASLLPGQAGPWFDMGRVLRRMGDLAGARVMYAWAAQLAPDDSKIAAERASLGLSVVPAPLAPPALGATTDNAIEHVAFGRRLSAAGDYLGASGEFLRALALEPANIEARVRLAQAYVHRNLSQQAALEFHKVLLADPANAEAAAALSGRHGF